MTTVQIPGTVTASGGAVTVGTVSTDPAPTRDPRIAPPYIDPREARVLAIRELRDFTQHLVGDLLTLIDASIIDPTQNRALKTLAKRVIWDDHYNAARNWAERQVDIEARAGEPPQTWADVNVSLTGPQTWNVFPFSRNGGPEPVDERHPDPR